jgi:hypothetical protein
LTHDKDAPATKVDIVKQEVLKLDHDVKIRDNQIQALTDRLTVYE